MIDDKIIQLYVSKEAPRHRFYKDSIDIAQQIEPHSDGVYPTNLIDTARPNEPDIYKEYRKSVWEPITKTYYDKVFNLLGKIQMADDWAVKWPELKGSYPKGENPIEYLSQNYPDFGSLENWFFSVGLDAMLDDPNSVIAVYPHSTIIPDNELYKPIAHIFKSGEVIEHVNNELCVIKLEEIPDADERYVDFEYQLPTDKSVIIFFDKNTVEKWIKVKRGDSEFYIQYYSYEHNMGMLPCFKIGGKIRKYEQGEKLYESFIQSCIPHWNEAVRRRSDHQVNMALHLHPDRWEIADQECKVCKGNGSINKTINGVVEAHGCKNCNGAGKVGIKTPFNVKMIRPMTKTGASEFTSVPTPPMGYAERPIETIDYLNKEWKQDVQQGLSALNMEFLMYEPAVNSGIAKSLDRSELNAYISKVARHIIENILIPTMHIICKERYGKKDGEEQVKAMLPAIKVPVKYDIVLASFLLELMKYAKESGVPSNVLNQMYLEYASKEFGKESFAYMVVYNSMLLDPLGSMTVDEKMVVKSNQGCTEEQYVISNQLNSFIIRAFEEDKTFSEKPLAEKMKVMESYAKEVIEKAKESIVPIVPIPNQNAA